MRKNVISVILLLQFLFHPVPGISAASASSYGAFYHEICRIKENNFYDPAIISKRFPAIEKKYN